MDPDALWQMILENLRILQATHRTGMNATTSSPTCEI